MKVIYKRSMLDKFRDLVRGVDNIDNIDYMEMSEDEWNELMSDTCRTWTRTTIDGSGSTSVKECEGVKIEVLSDTYKHTLRSGLHTSTWRLLNPKKQYNPPKHYNLPKPAETGIVVDVRPRQSGKTTDLIRACAEVKGTIVCFNHDRAKQVERAAADLGLGRYINTVIAHRVQHNSGCVSGARLFIDDADLVLRSLFNRDITHMTLTGADDA